MSINELISLGMKQPEMPDTEANRLKKMLMAAEIGKSWAEVPLEREKLAIQKENLSLHRQQLQQQKEQHDVDRVFKAYSAMVEEAPSITLDNYDIWKGSLEKRGLPPGLLPNKSTFYQNEYPGGPFPVPAPEQKFEAYRNEKLPSAKRNLEELKVLIEKQKLDQGKQFQPKLFINKEGKKTWVHPGKEVPEGFDLYEKPNKDKEIDKLTVWKTAKEAIAAGLAAGPPRGKDTVAKPAKGGYIYEYETPVEKEQATRKWELQTGTGLRKEFNNLPEVKNFAETNQKMEVMEQAILESKKNKNNIAVDQALINLYNKFTDPQSVVRESEYARTPQNMPIINRFVGAFEKIQKGGAGLTNEDRQALIVMARKFNETYQKKYQSRLHEYRGYLKNYELDPDKYLTPYGKQEGGDIKSLSNDELLRRLEGK